MTNRIPVEKFDFPVEKIKSGYYTDAYFLRSEEILNGDNHHPRVLMQIFARDNVVLCGTDEVIALIKNVLSIRKTSPSMLSTTAPKLKNGKLL